MRSPLTPTLSPVTRCIGKGNGSPGEGRERGDLVIPEIIREGVWE
jgi:hypothetical protein